MKVQRYGASNAAMRSKYTTELPSPHMHNLTLVEQLKFVYNIMEGVGRLLNAIMFMLLTGGQSQEDMDLY